MDEADELFCELMRSMTGLSDEELEGLLEAKRSAEFQFTQEQCWKGWGKLRALRDSVELTAAGLPADDPMRGVLLGLVDESHRHPGYVKEETA